MTQRPFDTGAQEYNRWWKSQQPKAKPAGIPETVTRIPSDAIDGDDEQVQDIPPKALHDMKRRARENTTRPVEVRRSGDRFVVIDGVRRVAVYRAIGMTDIPAIIQGAPLQPKPAGIIPSSEKPPVVPQQPQQMPKKQQQDQEGPPECKECAARPDCKKVLKLWHERAPRPDLARGWYDLIEKNKAQMNCLSGMDVEP